MHNSLVITSFSKKTTWPRTYLCIQSFVKGALPISFIFPYFLDAKVIDRITATLHFIATALGLVVADAVNA
jgi:hypothetical protein